MIMSDSNSHVRILAIIYITNTVSYFSFVILYMIKSTILYNKDVNMVLNNAMLSVMIPGFLISLIAAFSINI